MTTAAPLVICEIAATAAQRLIGMTMANSINSTITQGITLSTNGAYNSPLTITGHGAVIAPGIAIYGPDSQPWFVDNAGTIYGGPGYGVGVDLGEGGGVANTSSTATIEGSRYGIRIATNDDDDSGYVRNAGTIEGGIAGVALSVQQGTIVNGSPTETGAVISGGTNGVYISSQYSGHIENYGTIAGTAGSGVVLNDGGTLVNGPSGDTAGLISGAQGGVLANGAAGTVVNSGTIAGTDGSSYGVELLKGGIVDNGAYGATTGLISGGEFGVKVAGAAGTVSNYGTIEATVTGGIGVKFTGAFNDTLTNAGTIAGDNGDAVLFGTGDNSLYLYPGATFVGTVDGGTSGHNTLWLTEGTDTGSITGIGTSFVNFGTIRVVYDANWALTGSNTLASGTTLIVQGMVDGPYGTLTNSGTLTDNGTLADNGVFTNDGTVTGTGTLTVGDTGTLVNSGSIGLQVALYSGSELDNTGTGSISFAGDPAIFGTGDLVSIANAGTIASTGNLGIYLGDGGTVANGPSGATTALISGGGDAIVVKGAAGTVTNDGTINSTAAAGIALYKGGSVTNGTGGATAALIAGDTDGVDINGAAGTVTNSGTIAGTLDRGVYLGDGGRVLNNGTAALISGSGDAIVVKGAAGIIGNYGTINSTSAAGVALYKAGFVFNGIGAAQALISGDADGVDTNGAAGTVGNYGTITGTLGSGIHLFDGGSVANSLTAALISGHTTGVYVTGAAGTVTNDGTITASAGIGVKFIGAFDDTLTNAGTIAGASGDDAVQFGSGDNLLILDPGAMFTGTVDGGSGGDSTLELAAGATTGTISGLGTSFVNFGTIVVEPGASWTLNGNNTIAGGVTLTDAGTLTNAGTLTGSGMLTVDPGTLINSGSIGIQATLDSGSYLYNSGTGTIAPASEAGVVGTGGPVSVANAGTIVGTGIAAQGVGIYLQDGGNVTNGPGGATAALISGSTAGILVENQTGTVANAGTITGGDAGIFLGAGGSVVNAATGRISGSNYALYGGYGNRVSLTNDGTILGTGVDEVGVWERFGGTVVNGSTDATAALISGSSTGLEIGRGAAAPHPGTTANYAPLMGTVTNYGTIAGGSVGDGVLLDKGGAVDNRATGLISGGYYGVYVDPEQASRTGRFGGVGTVSNLGTIESTAAAGAGVDLGEGGTLVNGAPGVATALISGAENGVVVGAGRASLAIVPTPATVTNYGTIVGGSGNGVGGAYTVENLGTAALITGGGVGVTLTDLYVGPTLSVPGILTNAGTIIGTSRYGVDLPVGTITNGVGDVTSALISGGEYGVFAVGHLSTVINYGTITGTANEGVELTRGGDLVNGAIGNTSAAITGGYDGVELRYLTNRLTVGTVTNYGTITGTADDGVLLGGGGILANIGAAALIAGAEAGLVVLNSTGTGTTSGIVTNAGTIEATGAGGIGIDILGIADNTVTNAGTIAGDGGDALLFGVGNDILIADPGAVFVGTVDGGAGSNTLGLGAGTSTGTITLSGTTASGFGTSFVNFGTIAVEPNASWVVAGSGAAQVTIDSGGTLGVTGTISPASGDAVTGAGAGVSLVNTGTISASTGDGVRLNDGGGIDNSGSAALISGAYGVYVKGAAGSVTNAGTIAGIPGDLYGVYLQDGGRVDNSGLIESLGGPTGALGISVSVGGSGAAGTVTNTGTVISTGTNRGFGIALGDGGSVANSGTGALISGYDDGIVFVGSAAGTVTNTGTIEGTGTAGYGVRLYHGGSVANTGQSALISGHGVGIIIQGAAGTVTNTGTIVGTDGPGVVFLGPHFDDTVTNAGTIAGDVDAVSFDSGNDRLIVDPGAVFVGKADGGLGNNTLELTGGASTGTITGLGTSFVNFGTVTVDAGTRWVLANGNTIASGVTLTDLGTLTNTGTLTGGGSLIVDPATLVNSAFIGVSTTLSAGSYLDNSGTISVTGNAVTGTGGAATVTNTGTIAGAGTGISLTAGSTVTDAGTISGSTAISFGSGTGNNLLVLERGYALTGAVVGATGAGATNTLLLQGTGSANAVTADYNSLGLTNFGTVGFASNLNNYATLEITDSVVLPGTIAGFVAAHDIVDLTQLSDAHDDATASLNALTDVLTVVGDNGSVQLQLDSENYSNVVWSASSDGSGGTDVGMHAAPPAAPSGLTLSPASDSGVAGDDITNVTSPTITGSGVAGDSLTLFDGTSVVGTGSVGGGGTWSIATSTLAAGAHSLTATESNLGATSTASAALTITIDTASPVTTPQSVSVAGNSPAAAIGIAAPTDADFAVSALAVTVTGLPTDGTVLLADGVTPLTQGESLTVAQLAGLEFEPTRNLFSTSSTFIYEVSDPAGNTATGSADLAIQNLPAAPSGLTLAPSSDSGVQDDDITNVTTPTITGTGIAGDSVTLFDGMSAVGTGTVSGGGTWSITTGTLAAGVHSLTATESDAGVVSAASVVLAITIDTALPVTTPQSLSVAGNSPASVIGIVAPSDADFATAALAITVTGLPTDGTVMLADGVTPLTEGESLTAAQLANLEFLPTPDLFDASSTFTYSVTDPAGNTAAGSAGLAIQNPPAAPAALTLAPSSDSGVQDDDITKVTTPTITGMGVAGDRVTLRDGTRVVGTATVGSTGTWSITTSTLAAGTHSLTATETDAAGDASGASAVLELTIKTSTPAPSSLSFAVAADEGIAGDTVTVAGNGEAGDTVTLFDRSIAIGTAEVAADGTWSITTASPLAIGAHALRASEVDVAANRSFASASQSPTITSATPNGVTFTGTAGKDVFTGGAGNDIFKFSAAHLAATDTIVGGLGRDELYMTTAGTVKSGGVSGVETYHLANGGANRLTLTNGNFAGVTGNKITVKGGSGGNTINASAVTGTNRIVAVGGAGKDVFTGGAGKDIFEFSAANLATSDKVKGGAGSDELLMTTAGTVNAGGVSGVETYHLANGGANTLTLKNGNFAGVTDNKITVKGGSGGNTINASGLTGSHQAILIGGAGADVLIAGQHETMTGGAGADIFAFTTPGTLALPDTNKITDFTHSTDKIDFSDAGFSLGLSGASSTLQALPSTLFTSNSTGSFTSADQRFAYNTTTGALNYDAHGNTAGSSVQLVATLSGHPTLTAADLFFVS